MNPDTNQITYADAKVVRVYDRLRTLTKGEQRIFAEFAQQLRDKDVLDIGVGGGRTTSFLFSIVRSYIGVDYSQGMVEQCKKRFAETDAKYFCHDDARTLNTVCGKIFDTVIFSFNGIDYVPLDERRQIIGRVAEVLKKGGYFIFSFHNALVLPKLYKYAWSKNPLNWRNNLLRVKKLHHFNGPWQQYAGKDFFIIKDGGENFRLDTAYTRPSYQRRMMEEQGFEVVAALDDIKGVAMNVEQLDQEETDWVYFVCKKR